VRNFRGTGYTVYLHGFESPRMGFPDAVGTVSSVELFWVGQDSSWLFADRRRSRGMLSSTKRVICSDISSQSIPSS